jgi:hypothetical protein
MQLLSWLSTAGCTVHSSENDGLPATALLRLVERSLCSGPQDLRFRWHLHDRVAPGYYAGKLTPSREIHREIERPNDEERNISKKLDHWQSSGSWQKRSREVQ